MTHQELDTHFDERLARQSDTDALVEGACRHCFLLCVHDVFPVMCL